MKRRKTFIITGIFLIILISCTGCLDFFNQVTQKQVTYEQHPTKINYHITYGYDINITGTGHSTIQYREDFPELLQGTISNIIIHNQLDSQTKTYLGNEMIDWNQTFEDSKNIFLGISAEVYAESTLIENLDENLALTTDQIKTMHHTISNAYCAPQGNHTTLFINPDNPNISNTAKAIQMTVNTTNSLTLAKELFTWLKTHIQYSNHLKDHRIQPASETILKKTGDCDDLSFLYISLCRAVSIPARFIRGFLVNDQNGMQDVIPHVWVEIYVGNNIGNDGWMPIECAGTGIINAEIHQNFGIEDAFHLRLYTDDGSNASMNLYTNHIMVEYVSGLQINIQNRSIISQFHIIESSKLRVTDDTTREYLSLIHI